VTYNLRKSTQCTLFPPSPYSLVFRHYVHYPVLRHPQLITAFTVNKNTS